MSTLPVLHSTNMVNQAVQFEADLSQLQTPIPDGTLIYARDTQVVFVFNPTSAAGNVPGVSRVANGGGAFLAVANLSSLGGTVEYFDTVQGGVAGQVGLKDTVPTTVVGAIVGGNVAPQDGLAGDAWFWNPTSVAADDNQTIIRPTALPVAGRWIRIANQFFGYSNTVPPVDLNMLSPRMFFSNQNDFTFQMHNTTGVGRNVIIAAGASTAGGNAGGNLTLSSGTGNGAGVSGKVRLFSGTAEAFPGTELLEFGLVLGEVNVQMPALTVLRYAFGNTQGIVYQVGAVSYRNAGGNVAFDIDCVNRRLCLTGDQSIILAGTNGVNVTGIANASTVPTVNPVGGGVFYTNAGAFVYRGSGGTVTTIAPA